MITRGFLCLHLLPASRSIRRVLPKHEEKVIYLILEKRTPCFFLQIYFILYFPSKTVAIRRPATFFPAYRTLFLPAPQLITAFRLTSNERSFTSSTINTINTTLLFFLSFPKMQIIAERC